MCCKYSHGKIGKRAGALSRIYLRQALEAGAKKATQARAAEAATLSSHAATLSAQAATPCTQARAAAEGRAAAEARLVAEQTAAEQAR